MGTLNTSPLPRDVSMRQPMERFPLMLLVAGWVCYVIVVVVMAVTRVSQGDDVQTPDPPTESIPVAFFQLAEDYPEPFRNHLGEPGPESFKVALQVGRETYIAEGCWHCHTQQVRPVGGDPERFGRVTFAAESLNVMNFPHLLGTRRVGPDLARESGRRSNDWHVAHFYNPRAVNPTSVMPRYGWFFDGREPNKKGIAIITYIQWLGSNVEQQ